MSAILKTVNENWEIVAGGAAVAAFIAICVGAVAAGVNSTVKTNEKAIEDAQIDCSKSDAIVCKQVDENKQKHKTLSTIAIVLAVLAIIAGGLTFVAIKQAKQVKLNMFYF